MRFSSQINYADFVPASASGGGSFYGGEIAFLPELTVFGQDLPEFTAWACERGVTRVRKVADPSDFFAQSHQFVAHEYDRPVTLDTIGEISTHVRAILGKAERLVLFIEITDRCTLETIRRALRTHMPDMTFRIIYPRSVYEATGLQIITVEKKRPRIFLFMSDKTGVGKTETSLWFAEKTGVRLVHGDEFYLGIQSGKIDASNDLRFRVSELTDVSPFDPSLFAQFVDAIPAFDASEDVAFDFYMPLHKQAGVIDHFSSRGFFPIACSMGADHEKIDDLHARVQHLVGEVEQLHDSAKAAWGETERFHLAASAAWHEAKLQHQAAAAARRDAERHQQDAAAAQRVAIAAREAAAAARHETEMLREQANAYRAAIETSTSWRLTAPLRSLREGLRAMSRSARTYGVPIRQ